MSPRSSGSLTRGFQSPAPAVSLAEAAKTDALLFGQPGRDVELADGRTVQTQEVGARERQGD
jgi:hypothetical protein